jgi:hypothetical protein
MKKSVPLSPANIERLMKQTKALQKELNRITEPAEKELAKEVSTLLNRNLASLGGNVDGNDVYGTISVEKQANSTLVTWRGDQISYIEFGTGQRGFIYAYPDQAFMTALGYTLNPERTFWFYTDNAGKHSNYSHGLEAQAPMWKTAAEMRKVNTNVTLKPLVKKAINNAFNS